MLQAAPKRFTGYLHDLFSNHLALALPPQDHVTELHATLMEYVQRGPRVFAVRNRNTLERASTLRTGGGDQIVWTDNSPPWAIHSILFKGEFLDPESFANWLKTMPIEFNTAHARKLDLINKAGYHVAHLFDVQNGRDNRDPGGWSTREVEIRFLRNIHPCNAFYVPLAKWQQYGGDPAVKAFFYERYSHRYRKLWDEFLQAVAGESLSPADPETRYSYSEADWVRATERFRKYRLVRASTNRTTPQIRAIVAILNRDGRGEWSVDDICSLMSKGLAAGDLKTRQDPHRIFRYYLKDLLDEQVLMKIE